MSLLPDSLEMSVLLEVPKLHQRPLQAVQDEFDSIREEAVELLCSKGDLLLYGSKKKGEVAHIHAKVAKALSLMSVLVPGGVKAFGREFHHPYPELQDAKTERP
jgi:hypothetical protein